MPGYKDGEVAVDEMLLLAIIWCSGDITSKCEAFFRALNPPGQSQEAASANDRDWPNVFDKLVYLATVFTYQAAQAFGQSVEDFDIEFHKKAIALMRDNHEEEDGDQSKISFIHLLFGYDSRMKKEEFISELEQPKCNWIFDSSKIRDRLKGFLDPAWVDN